MGKQIGNIYSGDSELKSVQSKYYKYMKMVQERTESAYKAFIEESDREVRLELKKAYMDAVRALTIESKEYNALIEKVTCTLAHVNQRALDVVNDGISEVYAINYNQVADVCKEAGIEVVE
jgi:hypothetical protein